MLNVFFYELKALRYRTLLWIIAITLMLALYLSIYPAFASDVEALKKTFANIPPAFQHMMGVGVMQMFSFLGFFGNIFPFITLLGAIQAAVTGLTMLSKEQTSKTTDFLLTKPQTRTWIFLQKHDAGFLSLLVAQTVLVGIAFLVAAVVNVGEFDHTRFLMFWGSFALIQFWFYALGLLLSQIVKKIKSVTPLALAVSFGFFVVAMFGMIVGDDAVRWLTPFRLVDYKKIVLDGAYDIGHILFGLVCIIIFTAASYVIYTRKDVPSAL